MAFDELPDEQTKEKEGEREKIIELKTWSQLVSSH
jgi:hypothetical protein